MFQFIYVKQWSDYFWKKKICFTLYFRRWQTILFYFILFIYLQKQYLRGSRVLHLPAARGEELRGNVSTVTLDKPFGEKLQRASPCFYLKDGQRRPKADCTCSLQACCCRGLPRTHTLSRGSARFQDILIKSQWFLSERTVMCCTLLCVHPNRTVWLMRPHAMVDVNTIYTALIQPPPGAGLLEHVSDHQPERQTDAEHPEYGPWLRVVILSEHANFLEIRWCNCIIWPLTICRIHSCSWVLLHALSVNMMLLL